MAALGRDLGGGDGGGAGSGGRRADELVHGLGGLVLDCAECRGARVFHQPDCDDGHGGDCPEWACLECGHGVSTSVVLAQEAPPVALSA